MKTTKSPQPTSTDAATAIDKAMAALAPHAQVLDAELWGELRAAAEGLESALAAAREEGRNLRIAVVGQMKAGKSSFLNAAFFDRNLLPKADTPMTAALTQICYAPATHAEVIFYSTEDWEGIEKRSQDYEIQYQQVEKRLIEESQTVFSAPYKPTRKDVESKLEIGCVAAHELVQKALNLGLDVKQYLGQRHELPALADPAELASALHEYVGSGGKFTPLTKMSVLYVNDARLQGLEIIDTPGFNDPVVSRGQQTREFLKRCDVVFLLSTVSQFITSTDMELIRTQLPASGVDEKAVFLVGSQRDVALRQDAKIVATAENMVAKISPEHRAGAKVVAMLQLLQKKMSEYSADTLNRQANQPGSDDITKAVLQALRREEPHFVSAWSWLSAIGLETNTISTDDREQFDHLCRSTKFAFDPATLRQLSNIPQLREKVLAQRDNKTQLLASKEALLKQGIIVTVRNNLAAMKKSLQERGEKIRTGNIKDLEAMEADAIKRMKSGRAKLENVFDEQVVKSAQRFALLKTDLRERALQYSRVKSHREVETETYEVRTTPILKHFGMGRKEARTNEIVTIYADVQDTVETLVNFTISTIRALQQEVKDCVDLPALRRAVGQQAMALFDSSSSDFDAEGMLAVVEKSLRGITIPEVNFGDKDYTQTIVSEFGGGRVSEDSIGSLQAAQSSAIRMVLKDLESAVNMKVDEITNKLSATSNTFVSTLLQDIETTLKTLRQDIANKEQVLQTHAAALAALEQAQSTI